MYRVWTVITSVLPWRFGGIFRILLLYIYIYGCVTGRWSLWRTYNFDEEAINWKCDWLSSRWVIRFVPPSIFLVEIKNQNYSGRGKFVFSMVLLRVGFAIWKGEISDYLSDSSNFVLRFWSWSWKKGKIKCYRCRNLCSFDGENWRILEGDWKGKCDCEIFCFFEGGERRERGRIIKFYFDFARGEFLLYV